MKTINLSHSRLRTWRECSQLHFYKYVLKLEPKESKNKLTVGSCIHDMLAAIALGQNPIEIYEHYSTVFEQAEDKYDYTRIPEIVERYTNFWLYDPLEYEMVEEDLPKLELFNNNELRINLVGKVDGLAIDNKGKKWVVERKTSANQPDDKDRFFTSQAMIYVHLLRESGVKVHGVLWDYIRTKPPTIPERLKSGELTRRANIDTTPQIYMTQLLEHKLNPNDYREELARLEGKEYTFFRRHRQPVVESALDIIVEQAVRDARRMAKQQLSPTMNLHHGCKLCQYQAICQATLTQSDPDFIMEQYFRTRK